MQTSASGNEEERCYSYPFGDGLNCTGADATEHHFTGKERDQESGNDYFGARYYASTMGRWMSPDPSPAGVNVMNPQSWNLYNYALNNPLRMVDRNGYWATDIHAQIVTYSLQNYVSSGELNVLRARQYSMDADQSDQNRHSMANTGQSSQDALNGMWNYVRDEMNIVTSSTVGSGNSLNITGVNALGDAIHTLEDYTSPMHTDHAFMPMEWDGGTWPPSKWGPGLNHVLGEQSPDQDWSRIGLAVRLTMAAYLQSGEGCQSGKRCLTADNFEYEFQQNMTEYVNNFYATHNAGASSEAQKDAARQCALGNPAACD
jgi:RHS repeat-associated protein